MRGHWMMGMASAFALAIAAGCGSSVETTGSGANSGTGGGSGGHGGDGSGGSGGACAAFADQQGSASVTVIFRNNTEQPVYLPSDCAVPSYEISPASGPDGIDYTHEDSCGSTCEGLETNGPAECGGCPEWVFRIDPGKTLERTWNGTGLKGNVAMPDACWWQGPGGQHGGTCSQIVAAAPGMYAASATGFSECSGPCTCDASGLCQGTATGQQAYPNLPTFSFPSDKTVEVVFDICAFGCANPGG